MAEVVGNVNKQKRLYEYDVLIEQTNRLAIHDEPVKHPVALPATARDVVAKETQRRIAGIRRVEERLMIRKKTYIFYTCHAYCASTRRLKPKLIITKLFLIKNINPWILPLYYMYVYMYKCYFFVN